jgi:YVTN family beta-propeller protein
MRSGRPVRVLLVVLALAAGALATTGAGTALADTPTISVGDASVLEPLVGARSMTFIVSLSAPYADTVSVDFSTADGTATAPADYKAKTETLTFEPGRVTRHIGVKVFADLLTEGAETVKAKLTHAAGATIADGTGKGTIEDPTQQTITAPTPLDHVVIDPSGTCAYATNPTLNEVEVLNLKKGTLGKPILVGSIPMGIDITPDGSTLYVANSGAHNVSVVDVATRTELRRITIPSGFLNDRPFSIAVANNGKALLTTTFNGSGFGGAVYEITLATDAVKQRRDIGAVTEDTRLASSLDHSRIGMILGDVSSGEYNEYSADTDSFGHGEGLSTFIDYVAMDGDGSVMLIGPGTYVISPDLVLQGTVAGGGGAVAAAPDGLTGYRVRGSSLDVMNLDRFLTERTIPLSDQVAPRDEMAVTPDGSRLVALTENGFTIVSL